MRSGPAGGQPSGSGTHTKGGLYGDANDYFGKDRDAPD